MTYTNEELGRMKKNLSISDDEVAKGDPPQTIKTKDDIIRELERQLMDSNAEKEKVNKFNTTLAKQVYALETKLDSVQDELHAYMGVAAAKDDTIVELQKELESYKDAYRS
jgi:regulator of sirC expression with transglutaminase-like and TPR domain